jgi:hypothetical protein
MEFAETVYHLTSHGKVRQKSFFSDADLELFLDWLLGKFGKLRRQTAQKRYREFFRDGLDSGQGRS